MTLFFLSARAGGILQILQSDWFRERAEFFYLWPPDGHGNRTKTIEWKLKNNIPRLNSGIFLFIYLFTAQRGEFFVNSQFLPVL